VFAGHPWTKKRKNYAVLNIGGFNSELLIMKEGTPFSSTEITFGNKYLRKGKNKYKAFNQGLTNNLQKVFSYYQEKEKLKVEGLAVVGDHSGIPGLKKHLKKCLGIKAETTIPKKLNSGFLNDNGHNYAQALGLAIKGLSCNRGLNLMPPEARAARKAWIFNKEAKKFFRANVVFSLLISMLLAFILYSQIRKHNDIASEITSLTHTKNALISVIAENNVQNSKSIRLKRLSENQFSWSRLLYDIGCAVPPGTYLEEMTTESRMVSSDESMKMMSRLVIEGQAPNSQQVIIFVRNLEKHFTDIVIDKLKEESRCEFKISLAP
jgi:hypothetical protein